jgi:hypothetical protein
MRYLFGFEQFQANTTDTLSNLLECISGDRPKATYRLTLNVAIKQVQPQAGRIALNSITLIYKTTKNSLCFIRKHSSPTLQRCASACI